QALGRGQAVEPWLECGFVPARLLGGSEHVASVIGGSTLATLAFAEPRRRYELDAVAVRAQGGKLNGQKTFVPCGEAADLFIVTANLDGRTALFAVPREASGVEITPYTVADGSLAAVLTLRDVGAGEPLRSELSPAIE